MSLPRAFVLDDEPLAVERLVRLLRKSARVDVVASDSDPLAAVEWLNANSVDVLFLDIEMPGLQGFDVLAQLDRQPFVIFTTAFEQYALRAFQVYSIDYLLKPVEPAALNRALDKLSRIRAGSEPLPDLRKALESVLLQRQPQYPARLPSRTGDRIEFVALDEVTHFYAEDKLTFAAALDGKTHIIDSSISELEAKLDPSEWLRVHRSTLLHLPFVREVHGFFGGRLVVRLKDAKRTELPVARERVSELKQRLGL